MKELKNKMYMVLDTKSNFYCYLILKSGLRERTIKYTIRRIFYDLFDFWDKKEILRNKFEESIRNIKGIEVLGFIYSDVIKYICI